MLNVQRVQYEKTAEPRVILTIEDVTELRRAHLQDAHARVMSVASVQDHLQDVLGDVDVASYLAKLCGSLAASMIENSSQLKLTVRADPSTITSHDAVSLGLIVTELVINSLKHAFPEERKGCILVEYRTHNADGWSLTVTDDGVGRRATTGTKTKAGLGTSLVAALSHQLNARVEISDAEPGARVAVIHEVTSIVSPPLAA